MNNNNKDKIQVKVRDEQLAPVFSNDVEIGHTEDYFVLGFMYTGEPSGILISRIALTPKHMKDFSEAIIRNLKKWEETYNVS